MFLHDGAEKSAAVSAESEFYNQVQVNPNTAPPKPSNFVRTARQS
jgi:hypothetical protein